MRLASALMIAVVMCGCHMAQPRAAAEGTVKAMQAYVAGAPRKPTALNVDAAYAKLQEEQMTFVVVKGGKEKDTFTASITRVDDEQAPWRRDMHDGQVQHLRQTAEGVVEMVAVEDDEHDVISVFATPLVVMDVHLKPGQARRMESDVVVLKRGDRSQQVDKGHCTWTIEYDADQRIKTAAGTFDCKRIRTAYRGKFTMAKVTSVTYEYQNAEQGLVAEHSEENGVALFVPWHKSRTILRSK